MLIVTDIYGHKFEVTDLRAAIIQAEEFKDWSIDSEPDYTSERQQYWNDLYEKLLLLQ